MGADSSFAQQSLCPMVSELTVIRPAREHGLYPGVPLLRLFGGRGGGAPG